MRSIVNGPWFSRNSDVHRKLGVETVGEIITKYAVSHKNACNLNNADSIIRRLKRTKLYELVCTNTSLVG